MKSAARVGSPDDVAKVKRLPREETVADLLPDPNGGEPLAEEDTRTAAEREADAIVADVFDEELDGTEGSKLSRQTEIMEAGAEEPSGIQLILDLEAAGAITPVSLTLSDPTLAFERYTSLGRLFGRIKRSSSWWIGDWLNFGEHAYGEKYAQAAEATGLDPDTLMNYSYVARSIPRSRRRVLLSFSTHEAVAPLPPKEQAKWLDRAEEGQWSRSTLRKAIREAGEEGEAGGGGAGGSAGDGLTTADRIIDAARSVATMSTKDGPEYRTPSEQMERLLAALGIERR